MTDTETRNLGDRKAKISLLSGIHRPYGFEIIGSDRDKTKRWGALFSYTDACGLYI